MGKTLSALNRNKGGKMAGLMRSVEPEIRAPSSVTAHLQKVYLLAIHSLCHLIER